MKKFLPDLIAILAFIVISFIYFFPAITEDRILFQHDTVAGAGAGQEAKEYYERTGERTRWSANATSDEIRGLQSGQIQQYTYVFLLGTLALILLLLL